MPTHIWLRAESKPSEERTVLTPVFTKQLCDAGFDLTVEKSSQSVFGWDEYVDAGCRIVEEHTWKRDAPTEAIILGLKELDESKDPLVHRHIHFAHVYKDQTGWEKVLSRFKAGGGTLYDLEFLVDENGRRVAAFGHWAGFAGAAVAVESWCKHQSGDKTIDEPIVPRVSQDSLVNEIRAKVNELGRTPSVLIIGALGRCGKGASEFLNSIGASVTAWDIQETQAGGPFPEILQHDIFLNCVFVEKAIPPFIDNETIGGNLDRKLSVVCDVSCDPYGDYNPVPIYDRCTTFKNPVINLTDEENPLYLIAIDHLPSLLPRESSHDYCEQLMPHLLGLDNLEDGVWGRAEELFKSKIDMIESGE